MKSILSNTKGIALVTSLMFTLITLGIVLALLSIITQSIKISAATKRYRNASEAAYGGGELMAFDIMDNAWKNISLSGGVTTGLVTRYGGINLSAAVSDPCFSQKLRSSSAYWTDCSATQKSMELSTITSSPDLTFLLKGTSSNQNYKVYAKIVDTSSGNTDTASSAMVNADDSDGLLSGSGTAYSKTGGSIPIQHIPFGYRIEVQGENETNAVEKSNVTILYAY